jgi:hypothetical protein
MTYVEPSPLLCEPFERALTGYINARNITEIDEELVWAFEEP